MDIITILAITVGLGAYVSYTQDKRIKRLEEINETIERNRLNRIKLNYKKKHPYATNVEIFNSYMTIPTDSKKWNVSELIVGLDTGTMDTILANVPEDKLEVGCSTKKLLKD